MEELLLLLMETLTSWQMLLRFSPTLACQQIALQSCALKGAREWHSTPSATELAHSSFQCL